MTLPRLLRIASPSLFVVIWFASAVMGQTETATVSGLVTDRTAAAVSGEGGRPVSRGAPARREADAQQRFRREVALVVSQEHHPGRGGQELLAGQGPGRPPGSQAGRCVYDGCVGQHSG